MILVIAQRFSHQKHDKCVDCGAVSHAFKFGVVSITTH